MKLTLLGLDRHPFRQRKKLHLICSLVDDAVGGLPGAVNLVFCDDKTIHRLNREYRQKDKVTDVLTFTYYDENQLKNPDPDFLLGEVILSIPQTKRQAKEYDVSFESELYKLVIHGLLHLRGYDHEKDSDYRVMKLLEEKIMKSFLGSKKS